MRRITPTTRARRVASTTPAAAAPPPWATAWVRSTCYSPVSSWQDHVETTHQSHELRLSTPDDWRLRGLVGAFWEDFDIKDDMNFLYKSIPVLYSGESRCFTQAGTQVCTGNVIPAPGYAAIDPTERNDNVAFGEDLERGYKQTAVFTSIDYDLIPKVLTLTGGTRYYDYKETMEGSQYSHQHRVRGHPERRLRGHADHGGDCTMRPTAGSRAAVT